MLTDTMFQVYWIVFFFKKRKAEMDFSPNVKAKNKILPKQLSENIIVNKAALTSAPQASLHSSKAHLFKNKWGIWEIVLLFHSLQKE